MDIQNIASIAGMGHDVVDIPLFAQQLAVPGTRFEALFSAREKAQCRARESGEYAEHLAVRWAGKEAFLKAWSHALGSAETPYTMDNFPWSHIEILSDYSHRPSLVLGREVEGKLAECIKNPRIHVSLSHDGRMASAVVILEDVCAR
ncbi:holo-ACP synthase [Alloscardovia macacae]|uniref:holo-ACP synthase n=1 Tax=Alloscardovia macacae TaxID=1160091 RepID=UPI00214DA52D|nr:holo-ACP synthase [Alloscardovia macacae]